MTCSSRFLRISAAISVPILFCSIEIACTQGKNGARTRSTPPSSARVAGSGKDRYYVQDVRRKRLVGAQTNAAVELLPGEYLVELNGTTRPFTVNEGQNVTITAVGAMVAGSGRDRYYVQDVRGKSLVGAQTNAAVELLPGEYIVELNGTTQPITVNEGQNVTITAGGAMVAGSGKDRYYVQDVRGKSLMGARTNATVELLPGEYIVELNGATQRFRVRLGEQTIIRMNR